MSADLEATLQAMLADMKEAGRYPTWSSIVQQALDALSRQREEIAWLNAALDEARRALAAQPVVLLEPWRMVG